MRYAIIIERGEHNLSAWVPDLPGCVATGTTSDELGEWVREAIELHLSGIGKDGDPIPEPSTSCESVEAN